MDDNEIIKMVNNYGESIANEFFKRDGVLSDEERRALEDLRDGTNRILEMSSYVEEFKEVKSMWLKAQEVEP